MKYLYILSLLNSKLACSIFGYLQRLPQKQLHALGLIMSVDAKSLLEITEECIKSFNPSCTTVDAHADDFLGIDSDAGEVLHFFFYFVIPDFISNIPPSSYTQMICLSNKFYMDVFDTKSV